jgi:WD40 repeat protein
MHTQLLNRVDEWKTRQRAPGLLLRDPFLKEAEDWLMRAALAEQLPQPTDLQREYLSTSRGAEIRNGVTFRRRAMAGIIGLIGVVMIIWLLYLRADSNEKEANRQRGVAEEQTELARANEALANRRSRTLLEERGRQELIEGRWDSAAVLLAEAFRLGGDSPALRLMLGSALMPLAGARALLPAGDSVTTSTALSADATHVILGEHGGTATVWDAGTGRLVAVLGPHAGAIGEVHLNTDGSRALVVFTETKLDFSTNGFYNTYNTLASLWDVARSVAIKDTLDLRVYEPPSATRHPMVVVRAGGQRFAFPDGSECRFSDGEDVQPGPTEASTPLPAPRPYAVIDRLPSASTDGSLIVATSTGNSVPVWRVLPLAVAVPLARAEIGFHRGSREFVAVGGAGAIRRISAKNHTVSAAGSLPPGTATTLSPDGQSAIVIRAGTGVFVNLETGQIRDEEGWDDAAGARFSLDGGTVVVWSKVQRKRFSFWIRRAPDLQSLGGQVGAANHDVRVTAVSPLGAVAFLEAGVGQIWRSGRSAGSGVAQVSEDMTTAEPVLAEFSPDGRVLATARADGSITVRALSAAADHPPMRLHANGSVTTHLDISHDSRRLASASSDGTAKIWDLASGALVTTCRGHTDGVVAVRFSRDGQLLATGGKDGTARVWELPSCRELLRFPGHRGLVRTVLFDEEARRLATADDETVRVWELAPEMRTAEIVVDLTARLSPACLIDGVLGRWTRPPVGQSRGTCAVR